MPRDNRQKSRRGLASADSKTRKRVASMGGSSHDQLFFSEIGRLGGIKSRRSNRRNQGQQKNTQDDDQY